MATTDRLPLETALEHVYTLDDCVLEMLPKDNADQATTNVPVDSEHRPLVAHC